MLKNLKTLLANLASKQNTNTAGVRSISPAEFKAVVLEAKLPVLVDFYGPSCQPCKRLAPVLEGVTGKFQDRLLIVKMDTEAHATGDLRYQYGGPSSAIPALIFFNQGKVVHVHRGFLPEQQLVSLFENVLNSINQS